VGFAASHLANHALGLHSLDLMEAGRSLFLAVWRAPGLEWAVLAALILHPLLGLARLWQRRTLDMPPIELVQLALGLLIPTLLTLHLLGTGVAHRLLGIEDSYAFLLGLIWPDGMARQSLLLLLVWLHGCIGLHLWLRLRPAYPRWLPGLAALAALLPTLAALGTVAAGRELAALRAVDPSAGGRLVPLADQPWSQTRAFLVGPLEGWIVAGWLGLAAAVLLGRLVRAALARRGRIAITWDGGRAARVPPGLTLLEASRVAGVPHASVCGGRGRCSTCRVRVVAGLDALPPAAAIEARLLERIGAPAEVRLACQIRPRAPLAVVRLVPPAAAAAAVRRPMDPDQGREREIAVLFADLRGFTRLAERRLPYDVVFVLNRFVAVAGAAIERAGGRLDKVMGDGIMALFGLDDGPEEAARRALDAARGIGRGLAGLNAELASELGAPLRIGIGLHAGPAIVGELGYGRSAHLTAIGDTVNVASRLESLTKDLGVELVVSEDLLARAGCPLEAAERRLVELRGRAEGLAVRLVPEAAGLPEPERRSSADGARRGRARFGSGRSA
jgi:adenylate cyclase